MGLIDKLKKNSTLEDSDVLSVSKFFTEKDMIQTPVPMVNVALSGKIDGGLAPGLTVWAGPSKNFKTGFSLFLAKIYMEKYPDAALLFYDSEFGTPKSYWQTFGIDMDRVLHSPIVNLEKLKFDIIAQLEGVTRDDHIIIIVDSLGNLASKKELEDAMKEKSSEDMTRTKQIKSLFRMVTPYLNMKDIPMIAVMHTYKTLEMFSRDVVSGGTGPYYSADNIYILGRQQDAEKVEGKKELHGYNFIINVEKSRYVKEKSKIPISISFENGIYKFSGLFEIAKESGHVIKTINPKTGKETKSGWTSLVGGKEIMTDVSEDDMDASFWTPILKDKSFRDYVEDKYSLVTNSIMTDAEVEIYDEQIKKALT